MNINYKKTIGGILLGLSLITVLLALLSLIDAIPLWYFQIIDFPRLQLIFLSLFITLLYLLLWPKKTNTTTLVLGSVVICTGIHVMFLYPYLLGSKEVPCAAQSSEENGLSVLSCNVLMTNKNTSKLEALIDRIEPDVILLMEVDTFWTAQMAGLRQTHPYFIEEPLNNAYGMALYSKKEMRDIEVHYLKHTSVPSIESSIVLASGKEVKFYGVHPAAPFPSNKYPTSLGNEDEIKEEAELHTVGKMVKNNNMPTIVAGDYNDVSWASSERLFGIEDLLYDTRKGRGLINSFHSKYFFMRWPLDHYHVSEEFSVVKLQKLESIDSDHYPLFAEFVVDKSL